MNPGETLPRNREEEAELGETLHEKLSHLTARLQRLTGRPDDGRAAGESVSAAQRASDAFDLGINGSAAGQGSSDRGPDRPLPVAHPTAREIQGAASAPTASGRSVDNRHAAEDRLRTIRDRIEALKARHIGDGDTNLSRADSPPPRSSASERAEQAPERSRRASDFNAAIEEIAARQRAIDGSNGLGARDREPAARQREATAHTTIDRDRESEIAELRQRVDELTGSLARSGHQKARDSASAPFKETTDAEGPRRQPPAGDSLTELAGQLRSLDDGIAAIPPGPELEAIRVSQSAIARRLEELAARPAQGDFGAVAQQLLNRMPSGERIDALAVEIDRLNEKIAEADQSKALNQIAERLASFESRMSGLQATAGEPGISARLEAEMSGLRDAVEGLYRTLHNSGSPAFSRLEDRLSQVSARLESALEKAPRADSVADLLGRLEIIAARGESAPAALESLASEIAELRARERSELASLDMHIQTLAQRLDDAITGQAAGRASADVERRIEELTHRLDELAESPPGASSQQELNQLEAQLGQLSSRLANLGASDAPDGGLTRLEQQVASLLQRLETLSSDHETLQTVQENLSRLEAIVVDSEVNGVDNIQVAARDAVRELSGLGGGENAPAIEALKADLRELQAAADSNDRQTSATLDNVHQTLDRVVHRLAELESGLRGGATPAAPAPDTDAPSGTVGLARPAAQPKPSAEAPPQPLAPGSGQPARPAGPASDRDRRADFIAAARRAAQAAAAEHGAARRNSVLDDTADAEGGPGVLSRIGQTIVDRRRPLLFAVGAIVLAIAAIQIIRPFGGSDPAETEPAISEEVSPAAINGEAGNAVIAAEPDPVREVGRPAVNDPAPASPAFIPPVGVVSPRAADIEPPAMDIVGPAPADGADVAAVYEMPDEAVGSLRLRVAASAGDPAALYEVGARYADANGVPRDVTAAAMWFERAAEAGLAVAQHRIATHYEAGLGVPEDRGIAFQWYRAAADQGNIMAMHNIGVMFSQGLDGEPDFAAAVEWFTRAADRGIRDSQYNLGVIFARGIGVEQDLAASYRWFAIAATQGDTDAAARRDEVAATLSEGELAAARAAVSAWSPIGAPAEANMVETPEGGWDAEDERVDVDDQQQLVMTIQELLADRGYDPGPADGVVGPMTFDAVRAFQSAAGLEPNGAIDTRLLTALTE